MLVITAGMGTDACVCTSVCRPWAHAHTRTRTRTGNTCDVLQARHHTSPGQVRAARDTGIKDGSDDLDIGILCSVPFCAASLLVHVRVYACM
jgi:hypothetical protein